MSDSGPIMELNEVSNADVGEWLDGNLRAAILSLKKMAVVFEAETLGVIEPGSWNTDAWETVHSTASVLKKIRDLVTPVIGTRAGTPDEDSDEQFFALMRALYPHLKDGTECPDKKKPSSRKKSLTQKSTDVGGAWGDSVCP